MSGKTTPGGVKAGVGTYDTYLAALIDLQAMDDDAKAIIKDAVFVKHSGGLVIAHEGKTFTHPSYNSDSDDLFIMRSATVLADLDRDSYMVQGNATVTKTATNPLVITGAHVGNDGVVLGQLSAPGAAPNLWTVALGDVGTTFSLFFRHGSVQAPLDVRSGQWEGIDIENGDVIVVYGDGTDFLATVVGKGDKLPGFVAALSTSATGIPDRSIQAKVNGTLEIESIEIRRLS